MRRLRLGAWLAVPVALLAILTPTAAASPVAQEAPTKAAVLVEPEPAPTTEPIMVGGDITEMFGSSQAMASAVSAEEVAAQAEAARIQALRDQGLWGWTSPVPSGRVTSTFGPRAAPVPGASTYHNGTDLAAPAGTPILAAFDGVVVSVSNGHSEFGLSGWVVVLEHEVAGQTWRTSYNHMYASGVEVTKGQQVLAGEEIAKVGSEGFSSGPHLHFAVWEHAGRSGWEPIDAEPFMAERGVVLGR